MFRHLGSLSLLGAHLVMPSLFSSGHQHNKVLTLSVLVNTNKLSSVGADVKLPSSRLGLSPSYSLFTSFSLTPRITTIINCYQLLFVHKAGAQSPVFAFKEFEHYFPPRNVSAVHSSSNQVNTACLHNKMVNCWK